MENRQVNLHCHTALCKHAEGSVRDYCRKAVEQGLKILGFAEHSAFPDNRYGNTRMEYGQLEFYRQEIEAARGEFPELIILAGLEVDFDPEFPLDFYRTELKERLSLDFLAAGVHFVHDAAGKCIFAGSNGHHSVETVRLFTEKTVFLIRSGLFDFITHPDMVAGSIDRWTPEVKSLFSEVIRASAECGVPLEINAYGMRKAEIRYPEEIRHPYPWLPVWQLAAEASIPCVIGSDAHCPDDVYGNLSDLFSFAEKLGISCINNRIAEKIIQREGK